jgi:CRP-like cAMP-binding protein
MYLISKGIMSVINPNTKNVISYLFKGDYFGGTDVLRHSYMSHTHPLFYHDFADFGNVYSITPHAELLFLSNQALRRIPFKEVEGMIQRSREGRTKMHYLLNRSANPQPL